MQVLRSARAPEIATLMRDASNTRLRWLPASDGAAAPAGMCRNSSGSKFGNVPQYPMGKRSRDPTDAEVAKRVRSLRLHRAQAHGGAAVAWCMVRRSIPTIHAGTKRAAASARSTTSPSAASGRRELRTMLDVVKQASAAPRYRSIRNASTD